MPRTSISPARQGNLASQPLAAGAVGAMADGDADAVEDEALEIQELGLKRVRSLASRKQAPRRAPVLFQPSLTNSDSDASGGEGDNADATGDSGRFSRAIIGPDHPVVAVRKDSVDRVSVIGRRKEAAMKVMMPVIGRHAIPAVTDAAEAIASAMKDRSGTKAAAMECDAAASESTAMETAHLRWKPPPGATAPWKPPP